MEKSITPSQKISYLIIKYGTLALILEEGCNSVFRTEKLTDKISILDYFIENIICILKNKDVEYNSVKEFIDDFIVYIDNKKENLFLVITMKKHLVVQQLLKYLYKNIHLTNLINMKEIFFLKSFCY